jgi:L-rhamnose mutarotase
MASSEIVRIQQRKMNRRSIDKAYENSFQSYLIHYSCESFYDNISGQSRRVTSIAVRNLSSAQTHSWSIHKSAELLEMLDVMNENLDKLEKHMLKDYFTFLENHASYLFIHWNMRDEAYGFQAIEHRYRVLKGKPYILQDDRKLDLARVLVALYGRNYAPHESASGRRGRLMSLIEMNNIADTDALQGEEEAQAFKNGKYLELHRSTLRKVDAFANIIDRVHAGSLKTDAGFMDRYGIHPVAIIDAAKNHPLIAGLTLIGTIASATYSISKWL